MKAHVASLMNAVVLIGCGLWGYLSSETPSKTVPIPLVFGVVILSPYKGVKIEDKIIAHIAVLLTLLILGGLVKPLTAAVGRADGMATIRVSVMMVSTLVALGFFIKSFIDVRRAHAKIIFDRITRLMDRFFLQKDFRLSGYLNSHPVNPV